ncbi:fatty-acyl-CoA synthase [Herbihabitans rhizosphaerae]|uniref:Fatty-acyl-CoA synthase n=1 Tax=Herbihabitans rhizosphaerae TaxID=1872711 RepID=A0A4Q7L3Z7_9PSEU|nr:acyl-CoA synthetase [Herbihabitans rhizosphaerae]RZS43490.1 fatty-acyl-CoA synthase [Herbihabitans rhizosphaerae]
MTGKPTALGRRIADELVYVGLAARSGVLRADPPWRLARLARSYLRFGMLGALPQLAAGRHPDRAAVLDERGTFTFGELEAHSNAVAHAWRAKGFRPGEGIAILVRNHRGFLVATFAAAKCGARIVLLNTEFAGPQIREVAQREGTHLLVHDEEYTELLTGIDPPRGRFLAWTDSPGTDTLEALAAANPSTPPPKPGVIPKIILLTSGTTGTPKGAPRPEPRSLAPLGAILSKVPFRSGEVTECCAPMFHTLGFAHMLFGVALGSTLVVRRRFDPLSTMDSLEKHGATAMIVVPVMLQRLLELDSAALQRKLALRIIFVAGSQLGADLCRRTTAAFGPVVYNLYGSTEVAYATMATPDDLRVEPGCVGTPVRGAVIRILDENGREVPPGRTGRIFVGNTVQFEGYTGGQHKEIIDGLMSTGDVGHIDANGRLFVDGRDDDMIISGGENLFPGEVEELLATHESIIEAAAIGVPDEKFGQRLRAFVVVRDGATLTEEDVREHVRANLARYKVPRDVVFLDELPRNPTGKVLKRALAERPFKPS